MIPFTIPSADPPIQAATQRRATGSERRRRRTVRGSRMEALSAINGRHLLPGKESERPAHDEANDQGYSEPRAPRAFPDRRSQNEREQQEPNETFDKKRQ